MKIPKTFVELLRTPVHTPGQRCADTNWVNHDRCERTTNWSCGECGRPVCATHAHWHEKPPSKTWGTTRCRGISCDIRVMRPNHPVVAR